MVIRRIVKKDKRHGKGEDRWGNSNLRVVMWDEVMGASNLRVVMWVEMMGVLRVIKIAEGLIYSQIED